MLIKHVSDQVYDVFLDEPGWNCIRVQKQTVGGRNTIKILTKVELSREKFHSILKEVYSYSEKR